MFEKENRAFVLLLNNTNGGTLKSIFKKFYNLLDKHLHNDCWSKNQSFIEIIILLLEEKRNIDGTPFLIHQK